MLTCPKCNSGNIIPDRMSETGQKCLMCGTISGFIERERERVKTVSDQLALDFEPPILTEEQKAVWNCIRDRRGKGTEILGTEISSRTGIDYDRVRTVIGNLRRHKKKLIGSNTHGYYIPVTKEELHEYFASMRRRGITILWTVSQQAGISLEEIFHQGKLDLKQEEKCA